MRDDDDRDDSGTDDGGTDDGGTRADWQITVEPLRTSARPAPRAAHLARRGALTLLLVAMAAALVTIGSRSPAAPDNPVPQLFPTFAPEPTSVPTLPPGRGWIDAGPGDASAVAFAPSSASIGYSCGVPGSPLQNGPAAISVYGSQDGGATWEQLSSPAIGVGCQLSVDPTNAQDLFLLTNSCPSCTPALPLMWYRSRDGGHNWTPWPLPPHASPGAYDLATEHWAWVGSAFFITVYVFGENSTTLLAGSVDGGPFVWLDHSLFDGQPADASIVGLVAANAALYVVLSTPQECPPECISVRASRDYGSSWSAFAPSFGRAVSADVYLLAEQESADGVTLFGEILVGNVAPDPLAARGYVVSHDGGVTWELLPTPPGQLLPFHIYETPDGWVYADLGTGVAPRMLPPGIYTLADGATTWSFVAPYPGSNMGALALTWNASGHATEMWGAAHPPVQPGLQEYAL